MARPLLIVMVKEPRPGRVKTRLARGIGRVPATWWFRHQTRALLRGLRDPRWQLALAVSPDREGMDSRVWPRDLPRLPQGSGDLGARMARLLGLAHGARAVLIIGSDIPGLTPAHIARALAALAGQDAVFGPSEDGGYWLIGLSPARPAPRDFLKGVRWSGPHALADSITTLPTRRVVMTEPMCDVDDSADLTRLTRDIAASRKLG